VFLKASCVSCIQSIPVIADCVNVLEMGNRKGDDFLTQMEMYSNMYSTKYFAAERWVWRHCR